jgi:centrosomal protein CEP104
VLSHQSKIATKVEFEIKVKEADDWKKLGRISLDSNANTNYQARELKQANINEIEARFIRLILRQNHTNNQNLFNQVGLIGLSFYGFRGDELPPVQEKYSAPKSNLDVDSTTMNRIKELEMKKKKAVENEDYDLAR